MSESLAGQIERITFHNPENGFSVLRVRVEGLVELVTVVGNLTAVRAGEDLQATGRWVVNRDHGRQFEAETMRTLHPTSAEGIERYLASGVIKGIGPKTAAKIVSLYGTRALEILDDYPEQLTSIRGISREKLKGIKRSWNEQRSVREIMLFLHSYGIGAGRAARIYRTYGEQAITRIKQNPYQLAEDVRGIGFQTADELALQLGLDRQSPERIQAGVRFYLQESAKQGHCCFPQVETVTHAAQLLECDPDLVEDGIEALIQSRQLIAEKHDHDDWVFLPTLHGSEEQVVTAVHRLMDAEEHPLEEIDVEAALQAVEQSLSLELAEKQKDAIREACQQQVVVITGGPGVGKTTLIRSLLDIFEAEGKKCVLAAPTGRAAKRLAETTDRPASTVHRLLVYDPIRHWFQRHEGSPLEGDLFVLDETSMVDVQLAAGYLQAIPSGACVVLVGDTDQLPSVGPGRVLADLIDAGVMPVVRLTEIFRQAQQSRIVTAAYSVNQGELPELEPPTEGVTDFYFSECEDPTAIERMILRLVKERIPKAFGLNSMTDVQILSPMNRSALGARQLNQVLQAALNPPSDSPHLERFGWTFRLGDRVIQTVNNYDKDIYNGDLGLIESIDLNAEELIVNFDGRPVDYDFGSLDELSLAYVLTIHKSQGSEYPCVIIPLHTQHFLMLQRNLLYTGITRGKQLVVLVGSRRALEMAIDRQESNQRHTTLTERLRRFG